MTFARGTVPEHTHFAIPDCEKKKATYYFFPQFIFWVDIYACKISHTQEDDIPELGKEKREREREREKKVLGVPRCH